METRIVINEQTITIPTDLADALLAGLTNQTTVEPPTNAVDFDNLITVISATTRLMQHLKESRELAMATADATSPYANRRAIGTAAAMAPSQVLRVMERNGRPSARKAIGEATDALEKFIAAFNKPIPGKNRPDTEKEGA